MSTEVEPIGEDAQTEGDEIVANLASVTNHQIDYDLRMHVFRLYKNQVQGITSDLLLQNTVHQTVGKRGERKEHYFNSQWSIPYNDQESQDNHSLLFVGYDNQGKP